MSFGSVLDTGESAVKSCILQRTNKGALPVSELGGLLRWMTMATCFDTRNAIETLRPSNSGNSPDA